MRDGGEPVVVEQKTSNGWQYAVDGGDLVAGGVEQLERLQSGQLHRYVSEVITRDEQRTQRAEARERRRNLRAHITSLLLAFYSVEQSAVCATTYPLMH